MFSGNPLGLQMECDRIDQEVYGGSTTTEEFPRIPQIPPLVHSNVLHIPKGPATKERTGLKNVVPLSRLDYGVNDKSNFEENRYEGIKIKNIGFWKPSNEVNNKKRQFCEEGKTDYLPGVESLLHTTNMSGTDIIETPDKKRAPKKMKKIPEEIQNDWKNDKYNLLQYSNLIDSLIWNRPIKPVYIYFNTNTKHKEEMCQMLKAMGECETFVLKYYNEYGDAVEKSDEVPLSKASCKIGKVAVIVIDTVTKVIDGNFISMVNSRIRKHEAGGAILVTGVGSEDANVYRFENTRPINLVLMKNFQRVSVQCVNPFFHLEKRIRKIEKHLGSIQEKQTKCSI